MSGYESYMKSFEGCIKHYEHLPRHKQHVVQLMAMDMVLCYPKNRKTREELLQNEVYLASLQLSWEVVMDVVAVMGFETHHRKRMEQIRKNFKDEE